MLKLFFSIILSSFLFLKVTIVKAQIEGGVGLVTQKFFGSANSDFRFGIAPHFAVGYQNILFIGGEYQYLFPHLFQINEPIKEIATSKIIEISSEAKVKIQSYGFWLKYIWAQPSPKKRNQFYIQGGAVYMQYDYQLFNRQDYDRDKYSAIQASDEKLTAWMLEAGIGYEWLVGNWAGIYLEARGRYPLSRKSNTFEEIEINSALQLQAGIRIRYQKKK